VRLDFQDLWNIIYTGSIFQRIFNYGCKTQECNLKCPATPISLTVSLITNYISPLALSNRLTFLLYRIEKLSCQSTNDGDLEAV